MARAATVQKDEGSWAPHREGVFAALEMVDVVELHVLLHRLQAPGPTTLTELRNLAQATALHASPARHADSYLRRVRDGRRLTAAMVGEGIALHRADMHARLTPGTRAFNTIVGQLSLPDCGWLAVVLDRLSVLVGTQEDVDALAIVQGAGQLDDVDTVADAFEFIANALRGHSNAGLASLAPVEGSRK